MAIEDYEDKVAQKLESVISKIARIEEEYGVSILARGGSYGSSKLVILDNLSGKEMERR